MSILHIQQITKKYANADHNAVDGFSLEVQAGEIISLVGASGSGKTTLLRLIAGLEHPDSGVVVLAGREIVNGHKSVPAHKRQVGMVFQDYALFPHLTIAENVKFGVQDPQAATIADSILSLVGISNGRDKYPHQLSGGQQQRVALARAMAPKPSIILLDEPFSNLDEVLKDQVRDDIRRIIKTTGTTAIFVTHDTRDALSVADRIAIMKDGKLEQLGSPKELYNAPKSDYVANFFGKQNKIGAIATTKGFSTGFGEVQKMHELTVGSSCHLLFRPESAKISNSADQLTGTISKTAWYGASQTLTLTNANGEILEISCEPHLEFHIGETAHFVLNNFQYRS